jgi:hypothetical protein
MRCENRLMALEAYGKDQGQILIMAMEAATDVAPAKAGFLFRVFPWLSNTLTLCAMHPALYIDY